MIKWTRFLGSRHIVKHKIKNNVNLKNEEPMSMKDYVVIIYYVTATVAQW